MQNEQLSDFVSRAASPTQQRLAQQEYVVEADVFPDWEAAAFNKFEKAFETACVELSKL